MGLWQVSPSALEHPLGRQEEGSWEEPGSPRRGRRRARRVRALGSAAGSSARGLSGVGPQCCWESWRSAAAVPLAPRPPPPLPLEPRAQLLSDGHLHLAGAPGCRQRAGCSPCPPSPLGRYPARAEEADAASSCGVSVAPVPSASCLCKPSKGCWRWRHYS